MQLNASNVPKKEEEDLMMEDQTVKKDEKDEKNETFVQCNNWSPYYYDMFNRVGNLTVISLSKRRNAVIENLHAFRTKSSTWAERMKSKVPDKDFQDYAAVRIYWKYPDKKTYEQMKSEAANEAQLSKALGPLPKKGFYLFHDGDRVTEIAENDPDCTLYFYYNRRL